MQKKLIIFDRDGTLNKDIDGYIHDKSKCELFDDVYSFFSSIDTLFNICVATNQSGIGRGFYSENDMHEFNKTINKLIRLKTLHRGIDKFFFCPHLPSQNCNCRKPNNGLIKKALRYFKCHPNEAIVIGDKISDCEAAIKTGVLSILLNRNSKNLRIVEDKRFIYCNSLNLKSLGKHLF